MDRRRLAAVVAAIALALPACAQQAATEAPARALDVPYVPTKQVVVEKTSELAEVKAGDVLYDLGCGDGRIVVTAA